MATKKEKFQTAYEPHLKVEFETEGESLTQQQFAEASKINNIIAMHDRTGIIQNVQRGVAQYGDFSQITDYRGALDAIRQADEDFMELPSDIRRRFNNNAGELIEFVSKPENGDELVKMGLAKPRLKEVGDNLANTAEPAPESVTTEE